MKKTTQLPPSAAAGGFAAAAAVVFRREGRSSRAVRLDFTVTVGVPRPFEASSRRVPQELKVAVGVEIARKMREVVDGYLEEVFDEISGDAGKRPAAELPIVFLQVQKMRTVRASTVRVVKVELTAHSGDPMRGLGIPVVLYT